MSKVNILLHSHATVVSHNNDKGNLMVTAMPREKTSELIWQDTQHQTLFDLIDQIEANTSDCTIFGKLQAYADNHFDMEEQYMAVLKYPGADAHIRAHDKFRTELQKMVDSHHEYDAELRTSLSLFLREWLKRHIYGVDKEFEAFVLKSDAK